MKLYKNLAGLSILVQIVFACSRAYTQSNLLENGGFEADWSNQHYPRSNQTLDVNCPYPWLDYNPGDDERWFTDSVWPVSSNLPNPYYKAGYYSLSSDDVGSAWDHGVDMLSQSAHSGRCYIGFDAQSDWFTREGIQTKVSDNCGLNTGDYEVSLWWSRAFAGNPSDFYIHLSDQSSARRREIGARSIGLDTYTPGVWYYYSNTFDLSLSRTQDEGNTWLSVHGNTFISSESDHYTYLDDLRLYRPCDLTNACWPATGQICPQIVTAPPPSAPLQVLNITNANTMRVRLFVPGQNSNVWDTLYTNNNGLPDVKIPARLLATRLASGNYDAEITLSNQCGQHLAQAHIQILNGMFDTLDTWTDPTRNWTKVPVPCCLSTLTLEDMQIVGDVQIKVRDSLIVRNGVTASPGSQILLQAPVIELQDSVEYDGSVSDVTIEEMPCANRMMQDPEPIPTTASIPSPKPTKPQEAPITPQPQPAKASSQITLSPNPVKDILSIGLTVPSPTTAEVRIYNAQMLEVISIPQSPLPQGTHNLKVQMQDLPSGVYVVQIRTADQVRTGKVLKH